MTDTITRSPDDTGEIPRQVGEARTVIIHTDAHLRRDTTDEATQNLGQYARPDAPFPALRRQIDATAEIRIPETIGLAGPQSPPPPLPKPPRYDTSALERVVAGLDGELREVPLPRPIPYPPAPPKPQPGLWARLTYRGKHRGGAR